MTEWPDEFYRDEIEQVVGTGGAEQAWPVVERLLQDVWQTAVQDAQDEMEVRLAHAEASLRETVYHDGYQQGRLDGAAAERDRQAGIVDEVRRGVAQGFDRLSVEES